MKYFWILMFCMVLLSKGAFTQEDEDDDVDSVVEDVDSSEPEEINVPKEKRPVYKPPKAKGNAYLSEPFLTEENFKKRWVVSKAKKDGTDEAISKYDGVWKVEEPEDNPLQNDLGLVLKSKAKHHAVSTKLDKPFKFDGKPLIVQYEVKFQNGQECGGAYVKLLTHDSKQDLKMFYDKTPFTIMFGPDRCGNDDKLHFIFRHKHPVTGEFEEKHAKKPTASLGSYFTDKKTHLYRLVVNPDNSFVVSVDTDEVNSGSLLKDVEPPVNPAKEIVDPDDKKPEDWDEREKIADPEATKPEDWDETAPEFITDPDATKPEGWLDNEPELIPDPDSEKPADWDEDMDGEWEPAQISNPACESAPGCGTWSPPEIKNPAYKGKWKAPKIDNPNYKGKWKPRMIPNPNFFEDNDPYMMTSISAVGLELWSMSDGILFDNFLITDDMSVANRWTEDSFKVKTQQEMVRSGGKSVVQAVMDMTNEYPWLWAIIIIVVVLPIVLLFAYCCTGSSNKASDEAERKKTDAPSPDVKESEDDEDEEDSEEKEAQGSQEEESENNAVDSSGDAKQVNKTEPKKKSKSDLNEEAQEADAEEDEENGNSTPSKSTPRKRKTRARKD